jgi:hypothetical protein
LLFQISQKQHPLWFFCETQLHREFVAVDFAVEAISKMAFTGCRRHAGRFYEIDHGQKPTRMSVLR